MANPDVTVLIPAYNSEKTIRRCLESVVYQKYDGKISCIVYDDGSTDKTSWVAREFCEMYNVKVIRDTINLKRGYARNFLVNVTETELAVWLDADDYMHPNKIATQVDYMKTHPDCNYCQTAMYVGWLKDDMRFVKKDIGNCYPTDSYSQLEHKCEVNGCTMMFRTQVAKKYRYDESDIVDGMEDWSMWKQIILDGQKIHSVGLQPLYYYTLRDKVVVKDTEKHIFRFDDISSNTDLIECNKIAELLKKIFPYSTIQYALSPLVFDLSYEEKVVNRERPFPKIFGAYSDHRNFFSTDKIGLIDRSLLPIFVETKNHGLFHIDHRLLTKEQQEMSIIGGASLTKSKTFTPPFNKYNHDTIQICNEFNLSLDKFEDGWMSMEHEVWDSLNLMWYLHPRFWNESKMANYLSTGK